MRGHGPSFEKMDDLGLYHPQYSEGSLQELQNNQPPDHLAEALPNRFEYLKPALPVNVLGQDLTTDILAVKDTGNEQVGRGIFARKNIEAGAHVFEFDGTRIGEKKGVLPAAEGYSAHGVVVGTARESSGYFVYALPNNSSPLRYLNHSCEPNVARVPGDTFGFVALKPIAEGEEITADYSLLEANPYWELKECGCGSGQCRHDIRDVSSLSASMLGEHWERLIPGMQEFAIRYSRDPKIAAVRNQMGAEEMIQQRDHKYSSLQDSSVENIASSTHPTVINERNYLGAKRLAPIFLQEFVPDETERKTRTDKRLAA